VAASISIITPSLNQGRFIERTIQSVLRQDALASGEYVVIDGGSRDVTLDVLRRYEQQLRWVSEPDRGQAHAVNKGFQSTTGEVIGWLNSDDVYLPDALQLALEYLARNPEVDVVYGLAVHIDEQDRVLGRYPTEPFDRQRLIETCFLCQPAVFFRRRVLDRFGALDERLHFVLDYEYWLRLAFGGANFGYLEEVLAGWRLYPGIKSHAGRLRMHVEANGMFRERLGRVPDRWIYNYAHARLEGTSISPSRQLRFALALTLITMWASLRWNRRVPNSVRQTTSIWLKDGLKATQRSLIAQARAQVK
jgi:glycosyltransferase involved in cell wall biosynthesis